MLQNHNMSPNLCYIIDTCLFCCTAEMCQIWWEMHFHVFFLRLSWKKQQWKRWACMFVKLCNMNMQYTFFGIHLTQFAKWRINDEYDTRIMPYMAATKKGSADKQRQATNCSIGRKNVVKRNEKTYDANTPKHTEYEFEMEVYDESHYQHINKRANGSQKKICCSKWMISAEQWQDKEIPQRKINTIWIIVLMQKSHENGNSNSNNSADGWTMETIWSIIQKKIHL